MNRSIVYARPTPEGIEILCDCAFTTVLVVDGVLERAIEQAFTCDGCMTVHWFTLTPNNPQTSDDSEAKGTQ